MYFLPLSFISPVNVRILCCVSRREAWMHLRGSHLSFPKYKYAHIIFEIKPKAPLLSDLCYFKPPPPQSLH